MANTNGVKITAGLESTPGVAVARTHVLPIAGTGSLDRKIETAEDPVIVGSGMLAGEYPIRANVGGSIPLTPRACGGMGLVLKAALGAEAAPVQVAAMIRIKYTGADASCKIVAESVGKTVKAYTGAKGAESLDTDFGTAGTLTLGELTTDTVGEVVAAIDGLADYECKKIFGDDAAPIASVMTRATIQAKGKDAVIILTSADSGAYAHVFTPDLDIYAERPCLSIQQDGFGDNYLEDGCAVKGLSFSAALKDFVKGDLELLGMKETAGQTASELVLEDARVLSFADGLTVIDGTDYSYLRDASVKLANNHRDDGYGQGSIDRAYHEKGRFQVDGDFTIRLDATALDLRAKVHTGVLGSLLLAYKGKAIGASGAMELLLLEVPFAALSTADRAENSSAFDMKLSYKGTNPAGTNYDPPFTAILVTTDAAAYS